MLLTPCLFCCLAKRTYRLSNFTQVCIGRGILAINVRRALTYDDGNWPDGSWFSPNILLQICVCRRLCMKFSTGRRVLLRLLVLVHPRKRSHEALHLILVFPADVFFYPAPHFCLLFLLAYVILFGSLLTCNVFCARLCYYTFTS